MKLPGRSAPLAAARGLNAVRRVETSLLLGTSLIIFGLGEATSRIHIRGAFYAVVAQILPVLLLAIVVEGRYFRDLKHRSPYDRFLLRGLLFSPIVGEIACLIVVAQGHDALLPRGTVLFALGVLASSCCSTQQTAPPPRASATMREPKTSSIKARLASPERTTCKPARDGRAQDQRLDEPLGLRRQPTAASRPSRALRRLLGRKSGEEVWPTIPRTC